MKPLSRLLLSLGSCLLAHAALAGAGELLDQANAINTAGGAGLTPVSDLSMRAQTFTVGQSGLLTRVDLQIARLQLGTQNLTTRDLTFQVTRPLSSTVPVSAPLATFTLYPAQVPSTMELLSWVTFDLSASPLSVTSGEVFSLLLSSDQSYASQAYYEWVVTPATGVDFYTRGAGWQRNNATDPWFNSPPSTDYGFRTYVTAVPEPAALALLGLGALAWHWRRLYCTRG